MWLQRPVEVSSPACWSGSKSPRLHGEQSPLLWKWFTKHSVECILWARQVTGHTPAPEPLYIGIVLSVVLSLWGYMWATACWSVQSSSGSKSPRLHGEQSPLLWERCTKQTSCRSHFAVDSEGQKFELCTCFYSAFTVALPCIHISCCIHLKSYDLQNMPWDPLSLYFHKFNLINDMCKRCYRMNSSPSGIEVFWKLFEFSVTYEPFLKQIEKNKCKPFIWTVPATDPSNEKSTTSSTNLTLKYSVQRILPSGGVAVLHAQ